MAVTKAVLGIHVFGSSTLHPGRPLTITQRRSSHDKGSPRIMSRRSRFWPPEGYGKRATLGQREAEDLICKGASTFTGFREEVTHAPGHYKLFAIMESESSDRTDKATFQDAAFEDISLTVMTGIGESSMPWVSLDQPCMRYAFGRSPGTTTLTFYIGKSGSLAPTVHYGSKAKPRKMKLIAILERLRDLYICGLQEDNFEWQYRYLYDKLIEDPEANTNPHYDRAMQMADLLTVLSNPDWVDFSLPRNHVVAKYFDSADEKIKRRFFHQLLLAIELHLRIHAPDHGENAKRKLLSQLPPKVAWDLALAERWLANMSISRVELSPTQSTFTFDLLRKKRQKEALRSFASLLKWPNMEELDYILEEKDSKEKNIEDRSADTMSWFTGVILPGPTLPWLLMNTLIDCDRDTGEELKYLTHIHPNSGFQYRANTYWSSQCIVGKVLGAGRGVKQVAGWIGPCHYTPELERTQCVLIRQLDPLEQKLTTKDIDRVASRTSPLGPEAEEYPLHDYEILIPNRHPEEDIIRIEKLSFNHVGTDRAGVAPTTGRGARTFDAAIVFAFASAGTSLPIKLRYNVDFIYAFPCEGGPHALYRDYKYRVVKVDQGLADLHNWGQHNRISRPAQSSRSRAGRREIEEVLVIEAFGVSDNEVFARAWCAHWGVSAVVANVGDTCVGCAVREAWAGMVSVVILTEGGLEREGDLGIEI
ncbi:hypothetical protein EJ08DRAFT_672978 [Tothia fuscella]|uniref:Uncharacterized protein n=1 Tax=Tothia fuscella TaxID=1048955 RepID=A0A9P4TU68_9PEZI|nr:hypothetical protein EJ08DRAFT_672978 [Tothia fuscella]